jgi:hypothetical protein
VTVSSKLTPPAVADDGLRLLIVALGATTLKVIEFEAPPPALAAVTFTEPIAATRLAGTFAARRVALVTVVGRAMPPNRTVAPVRKFVPSTSNVKSPLPAGTEVGLIAVRVGLGAPTANGTLAELTPPGFTTVTIAVPGDVSRLAGIVALN